MIASTTALGACNQSHPANQVTESNTSREANAPLSEATVTNAAGISENSTGWSSLDAFVGKYPAESGLLDKSAIAGDLRSLLGEKLAVLRINTETNSPLLRENSVLYMSGNKTHEGGMEAAYLLIDPKARALEVGLWEKGKLSTYKTAGAKMAKPKDIRNMIANSEHS